MRPRNIVNFERLMFASLGLGFVNLAITWAQSPGAGLPLRGAGLVIFLGIIGLIVGLTLLISRRRSRIALWVTVALFVLGVPTTSKTIIASITEPTGIVMAVQSICQGLALILMFTPSVRRWMSRKPDPSAEAEIFS